MNCEIETHQIPKGRTRDPEATRACLLHCAFSEIYEHGYAGASLDRILADSGVTKGALYHHFGSKADLAKAVIDEVIRPFVVERWVEPVRNSDDPIATLREHALAVITDITDEEMARGCPLNNLAQELANAGEGFRRHISRVFDEWRAGLAEAFENAKAVGNVRREVDSDAVAAFIVAGLEGMATTMKSSRNRELARSVGMTLIEFLESLRPVPVQAPAA